MSLYRHPGMRALRVYPAAAAFLKQYTTNVIDAPRTVFLTREGKTVAAAWQVKISEDEALLAVPASYADKLLIHLSKYLALSETKIEPLPDHAVLFDLSSGACTIIRGGSGSGAVEDYTRFRVQHSLPEQGVDFTDEMPLCVDERLVHFDKGCYLGQEIVARVHYRGAPPKKLAVKRRSECTPEEFARMTSKSNIAGDIAGFLFV